MKCLFGAEDGALGFVLGKLYGATFPAQMV